VKTTEECYLEVAAALSEVLPAGWVKVYVEASIIDDHAKLIFRWENDSGEIKGFSPGFAAVDRIHEALDIVRTIMTGDGKQPWAKANYSLTKTGKFLLDFVY